MNAASSLSTGLVLSASVSASKESSVLDTVSIAPAAAGEKEAKGFTASLTKMESAAEAAAVPAETVVAAAAAVVAACEAAAAPAAVAAAPATAVPAAAVALTESWNNVFITSSALTSDTSLFTEGSRN